MIQRLSCFLMFTFCFVAAAFGQATSVSGTVSDPTGAVVVDAAITLTNIDTAAARTGATNKQGVYQFSQVAPGNYSITADSAGFGKATIAKVQLLVNTPSTFDITLQSASSEVVVDVTSSASQVNTSDASLGNVISTKPIVQLPLEGRNVTGLLALQPGVTFIKEPNPGSKNDYRSGSVNGGKSDQANVLLDGVDANDQQNRTSFTSVLRVTPDSIQEFRTITSNPSADLGHSSGAQVTLVTKGGTNTFHGSAYEYNRNTELEANQFLNKRATPVLARPALIRNVFGAAVGGPIKRDRAFLFMNYEGRRDASATSQNRTVPTDAFRAGTFTYATTTGGNNTLTPAQVQALDPQGMGENPAVLADFQKYPHSNIAGGDTINTGGYTFNAKTPLTYNTYIARADYNIDSAGKHTIFWRGNMQTDNYANGAPQFPGEPSSSVYVNFSKGYAFGYNWIVSPNVVNSLRFGYTRQSVSTTGTQKASTAYFDAITPLHAMGAASSTQAGGYATAQQLPVYDIRDDLTWSKGRHTIGFGGEMFFLHNHYATNSASFSNAFIDGLYLVNDGGDFLAPDAKKTTAYELQFTNLLGLEAKLQRRSNYDLSGNTLADGSTVKRNFAEKHFDLYVQDSWKARPNLTLTAGVRYTMSPPLTETQGFNVSSTQSLGAYLTKRGQLAASGQSQALAGNVTYDLSSKLGKSLYNFQNDFAPRVSFAWSPKFEHGIGRAITGDQDQFSIRGGFGLFYDAFGQGLERDYASAVGFSTLTQNGPGQQVANVPRYTGFYDVPFNASLFPKAVAGGFPQTPAAGGLAQASTVDSSIRSPYSMSENLSIARELKGGYLVQVSWVGRQSRRSLTGEDIAAPSDLYDTASNTDYFQAAKILSQAAQAGAATVPTVAYWENLWPGAASSTTTATQAIYQQFVANKNDWTSALLNFDAFCTPSCSKLGQNTMFNSQFAALYAFRSIGTGSYNGMQVLVRKSFSKGYQFDFNYSLSKCLDLGSSPESTGATTSTGSILNTWSPNQMHAVCDYDLRHQITAFGIAELPFGKGKAYGAGANKLTNALIGGWQLTTLFRTTSGFPGSVSNGVGYPTIWDFTGYATQTGKLPGKGPKGQMFSSSSAAYAAFAPTFAGESGTRNSLRGDGLITLDGGLSKRFDLYSIHDQQHSIQFRFEGFNLTNTARFDISTASLNLSTPGTFGKYLGPQQFIDPRVFQAALRYEF
ncbi:TonB-dependent receptor [Granulicella aggregans]|nr:TonB-dependent receptor [Granulicella aggregans]